MNISRYIEEYKELGIYFAPDYENDNIVLFNFKKEYPILSNAQASELKIILQSARSLYDKYFVADLMYLYNPMHEDLLLPMINCAIDHEDPSFNRIFIRPCIQSFGLDRITKILSQIGDENKATQSGIERLKYWLHPTEDWK